MIARNISAEHITEAAQRAGVAVSIERKGRGWSVKVDPSPTEPGRYQRIGRSGRRVHAVCWHGFRAFFKAAYALAPDATFRTILATYEGAGDFERRYRLTGTEQRGGGVRACDQCSCPEQGTAR